MKKLLLLPFLAIISFSSFEDMKFDIKTGIESVYTFKNPSATSYKDANLAKVDYTRFNFSLPSLRFKLGFYAYSEQNLFSEFALDNLNAGFKLSYETPDLSPNYSIFFNSDLKLAPKSTEGKFIVELGNKHILDSNFVLRYSLKYESHMLTKPEFLHTNLYVDYNGKKLTDNFMVSIKDNLDVLNTRKLHVKSLTFEKDEAYDVDRTYKVKNDISYNITDNFKISNNALVSIRTQNINDANKLLFNDRIAKKDKKFLERLIGVEFGVKADLQHLYKNLYLVLDAQSTAEVYANNLRDSHVAKLNNYEYKVGSKELPVAEKVKLLNYTVDLSSELGYKFNVTDKIDITPVFITSYKYEPNKYNELKFEAQGLFDFRPIDHLSVNAKVVVPVAVSFKKTSPVARYAYAGIGGGASVKYNW